MIQGLFENHLIVSDIKKSGEFYETTLGLKLALDLGQTRFYYIGQSGSAMLGLWQRGSTVDASSSPETSQIVPQHFAFKTSNDYMRRAWNWLSERGISPRNFYSDGTDCLYVHAWMPAVSVYFNDPDGHILELITVLPDQPKPELGLIAWDEWEKIHGRAPSNG